MLEKKSDENQGKLTKMWPNENFIWQVFLQTFLIGSDD